MEKYIYWGAGILVLLGLINSCNSSTKHREISTRPMPHPSAHLREPYLNTCFCPYDLVTDRRGFIRECGGMSAYERAGGAEPECYWGDRYARYGHPSY